jgi:transposase
MLESKLADLEERLGRNPRNSSMPPSAEGLSKPPVPSRAERRAAARKQGKQPGAPGKHLAQVAEPDQIISHAPVSCTSCGSGLEDAEVVDVEHRQVFDLPDIRLVVTEHIAERRRCQCGCTTKAGFPKAAIAPACYGPGIRALAAYLAVHQHLPMDRMSQLFGDVLGAPVSVGALAQMVTEAAGAVAPFLDVTRTLLQGAPAVHFDETGGRVEGSLHWVHSASTDRLTLIECHKRRGRVAMDDFRVIGEMSGVAIHDGWKPYRHYDVDHALCNAHHLRELIAVGIAGTRDGPTTYATFSARRSAPSNVLGPPGLTTSMPPPSTPSGSATDSWWRRGSAPTRPPRRANGRATRRRRSTSSLASTDIGPTCSGSPSTSKCHSTITRPNGTSGW